MSLDESVLIAIEARDKASAVIDTLVTKLHSIGPAADQGAGGAVKMAAEFAKAHPAMVATAVAGTGVAIAVGGMAVEAVKAAGNFQESMTQLVTGAGESKKNIGLVSDGILQMARDTGVATDKLSEGMYLVESAGFHGADGLTVLKAAAEGAKVGNADLHTVADAVTSALNAYGLKADDAAGMTSKMVTTVAQGKMHMQDLAGALSAVLPKAAAAGLSFDQVGGAMATMTSQGMSAQQASQDLANTIQSLQSPNAVAVQEMEQLGLNATQVSADLGKQGLTGTMKELSDAVVQHMGPAGLVVQDAFNKSVNAAKDVKDMLAKLPPEAQKVAEGFLNGTITQKDWMAEVKKLTPEQANLAKQFAATADKANGFNSLLKSGNPEAQTFAAAMGKMLGGATGLNTALMLTGDHAETFEENVKAVGGAAADASGDVKGWAEVQQDFNTKMDKAKQAFETTKIAIGTALLPVVSDLIDKFNEFIKPVADWITKNKDLTAQIILAVGALGLMIAAIAILNIVLNANPIALVVVGLAGLVAGLIYAYNHVGWFKDFVDTAWKVIATVSVWLWHNVLEPMWTSIVTLIRDYVAPVMVWLWHNIIEPAWNGISQIITTVWNWLRDNVVNPILDFVNNKLGPAFIWFWHNVIEPAWAGIKKAAGDAWSWVKTNVFDPIGSAVDAMGNAFTSAVKIVGDAWDKIKEAARGPVQFIVDTVYNNGIAAVWNAIAKPLGLKTLDPVTFGGGNNVSTGDSFTTSGAVHGFATGGVVPGYAPGHDVVNAMLSPGEGILIPQAVRGLGGAAGIEAINRMFGAGGHHDGVHFGNGGIVGDVFNAIGGFVGGALDALKNVALGGLKMAATPLVRAAEAAADAMPGSGTGWGKMLDSGVHVLGDGFLNWIGGKDDAANAAKKAAQASNIGAPGAVSGNVSQWIAAAMAAAGVGGSDWANGLATIIQFESGGNPRAQNNTDVNAQNGDPSRGLMQTIGATFEAYRSAALPDNIFDPVANIVAGIGYINSRYGGIGGVPGLISMANGGGYVGYDEGGWLEPGLTLAYNGTGQREAITSPSGAGPRGGGNVVYLDFRDAHVMTDADIQVLIDRIGRELATFVLPAAGVQIRR